MNEATATAPAGAEAFAIIKGALGNADLMYLKPHDGGATIVCLPWRTWRQIAGALLGRDEPAPEAR